MDSWFLENINPWLCVSATGLSITGVLTLYFAWKKPHRHWPLIGLGWLFIAAAYWPWVYATGVGRGTTMASILPGIISLILIIVRTPWREFGKEKYKKNSYTNESHQVASEPTTISLKEKYLHPVLIFFAQFFVVGILSFSAALFLSLALFTLLHGSNLDRTIYALMFMLVLWPLLMVWSHAKISLIRPALYLVGLSFVSISFVGLSLGGLLFTPGIF